ISTEIRRRDFRTERRGTSQMRTETDNNQQLRLDRTILRVDIGRLHRSLGLWISHLRGNLLQIPENLLGTTHDKYRLTAPFGHHLLARFDLADIYSHRCTGSLGLGTREPRSHKRDRGTHRSCSSYHRSGGYKEATPASIHAVIAHSVVSHQLLMACLTQACTT